MIPRLYSVTIGANDTTVTVNSPSLDFTGAVQHGWQLMIDGHSLPITIVSGGQGTLEIDPADAPSTALTARAAKVIETKGLMQIAADGLENARQELVAIKNSAKTTPDNDSMAKRLNDGRLKAKAGTANDDVINKGQTGTAAFKDVVESATDIVTGRILNVGAGGLLNSGNAPSILPDNTLYPSMLGRDGDGAGGYPVFGWASTILNMRYNNTRQSQIGVSHSAGVANIAFRTMVSDNLWTDVYNLFGEHNSKNPVEYGIGRRNPVSITDFALLPDAGMVGWWGNGVANKPSNVGSYGGFIQIPVAGSNYMTVYGDLSNELYFKYASDRSLDANKVYHSNNINFNRIGGAGNGDEVLLGAASSGTVARFLLDNFDLNQATGLTIDTGAFRVDTIAGATVSTGQPSVNVSLSSLTSTVIDVPVAGISGAGELLRLRCDGGAAYATITH